MSPLAVTQLAGRPCSAPPYTHAIHHNNRSIAYAAKYWRYTYHAMRTMTGMRKRTLELAEIQRVMGGGSTAGVTGPPSALVVKGGRSVGCTGCCAMTQLAVHVTAFLSARSGKGEASQARARCNHLHTLADHSARPVVLTGWERGHPRWRCRWRWWCSWPVVNCVPHCGLSVISGAWNALSARGDWRASPSPSKRTRRLPFHALSTEGRS
jgi:hypothetical protein